MRTLRPLALGHVALLLIACSGCAAKASPQWLSERRSELGTVVVAVSPEPPDSSFAYPVPSRAGAAATGAGAAPGVGVIAGAACLAYVWPACLLAAWTPVMMVTNGVEGAVKGVPIADIRASAASLKNASGADLASRLAERVASEAQRRAGEGGVRFAANELPDAGKFTVWARVRVLRAADGKVLYEVNFNRRGGPSEVHGMGPRGRRPVPRRAGSRARVDRRRDRRRILRHRPRLRPSLRRRPSLHRPPSLPRRPSPRRRPSERRRQPVTHPYQRWLGAAPSSRYAILMRVM